MNVSVSRENILNIVMGLSKSNREWLAERLLESVEGEYENPSPSNDPYFDNADNINAILQADKDIKAGKGKVLSIEEIMGSQSIRTMR